MRSIMDRFTVIAERTDLSTERTREVAMSMRLHRMLDGQVWLVLDGGPTGREAVQVTNYNIEALRTRNWVACVGERGRYDRLVVPAHELRRVLSGAGLPVEDIAA